MACFNATRSNPATPITARLFSTHPCTWSEVLSPTYQVPQEFLAEGVDPSFQVDQGDNRGVAYTQTPAGLYNHVDVVGLCLSLHAKPLHAIGKHLQSSLRTLDQGEFPVDIGREVFKDFKHSNMMKKIAKAHGRIPTLSECLELGGTPICDLGADDGRKVYAHWKVRMKPTDPYRYRGPKTLLLDRRPYTAVTSMPSLGPDEALQLPEGSITNLMYKEIDFDEQGLEFLPKEYLLVSINSLNQFPPSFIDKHVRTRAGIHMIPDVLKLVAEGKATQGPDGIITTKVLTKKGEQTFREYAHHFEYALFPTTTKSDYYHIYVEFSQCVVACDPTTGEITQAANTHEHKLKPKRFTQNKAAFLPPYKLKYDGRTMTLHITSDEVVFETANQFVTVETDFEHTCPIPVIVQGEYITGIDKVLFAPHTVWLAGRRLVGPVVGRFMDKTEFRVPGFEFINPQYHVTIDSAVQDLCTTTNLFPADGLVGFGGGEDVAAKLLESIDIRPCDHYVVSRVNARLAPRTAKWQFLDLTEEQQQLRGCQADLSLKPVIGKTGDARHSSCTIREFEIRDTQAEVVLREVRERSEKDNPNSISRIEITLPMIRGIGDEPAPTLLGMLADNQRTALELAGYRL